MDQVRHPGWGFNWGSNVVKCMLRGIFPPKPSPLQFQVGHFYRDLLHQQFQGRRTHFNGLWLTGIIRGWGLGCFRCPLHLSISEAVLPCFWMVFDVGPQKKQRSKNCWEVHEGSSWSNFRWRICTQQHTSRTLSPTLWYKPGKYVFVPKAANGRHTERSSPFWWAMIGNPPKKKSMKIKWVDGVGPQPISEHHGRPHWADIFLLLTSCNYNPDTEESAGEHCIFWLGAKLWNSSARKALPKNKPFLVMIKIIP